MAVLPIELASSRFYPQNLVYGFKNFFVLKTIFIMPFRLAWEEKEEHEIEHNTHNILYHILRRPVSSNMPIVLIVSGKSGRGKSETTITILNELLKRDGINFAEYLKDILVANPLDYMTVLDGVLYNKRLKKIHVVWLDEARMLISAEKWNEFINRAIPHMTALSRQVKPLVIVIVTQSLMDVQKSMRSLIDYEIKCTRVPFKSVKAKVREYYIDDRDPEKIRLRWKYPRGFFIEGKELRSFVFNEIEFKRAPKELLAIYDPIITARKSEFLKKIMNQTIERIKSELGSLDFSRVNHIYDHLNKSPDQFYYWTAKKGKKFVLKKEFGNFFNLDRIQVRELQRLINEKQESESYGVSKV